MGNAASVNEKKILLPNCKYILIVSSEPNHLVFLSILMQRIGYYTCSAGTAEMALEIANAVAPLIIITDLKLPMMNAFQMIPALKKNKSTASVPVIIRLERLVPIIRQKCLEAGAVSCLEKIIKPEEVYRAVQSATETKPREHIRIKTSLSVSPNSTQIHLDTGACAVMLSSRGMYVRTGALYPVRTKLPITINFAERNINVQAEVIYSHTKGEGPFDGPGMGLYFSEIASNDQEFLQQYINKQVTQGIVSV